MIRRTINLVRSFSSNRPAIYDVLPKKKTMNQVLFDLDSRLSYAKLYPVYESLYNNLDTENDPKLPKYINASDLMIMKRVLESIRVTTHSANRHLVDLENELVEKAAENGNNDAVALLAFEAIVDDKSTQDDKIYAKKLVSQLIELKHPLTLKLSGDLCLRNELNDQAEKFYNDFLLLESETFLASEVFKQLGVLNFQKPNLFKAKEFFERSVRTGPIDKVAESHYYLGQLNSNDPERARYHFELSASQGFRESFQQLGFLELNLFNNIKKAREWFKLGSEISDISCIIGLFDCSIREKQWKNAFRSYNTLKTLENSTEEQNQTIWNHFIESRSNSINLMNDNYTPLAHKIGKIQTLMDEETTTTKSDRWSI